MSDVEEQAAERAHRVLDLIESRREEELTVFLAGLSRVEAVAALVAVAAYLVDLEAEDRLDAVRNENLRKRVSELDQALVVAGRDRQKLAARVAELREINETQAERLRSVRENQMRKEAA